jgi:hypothetical protein
MDVGLIAKSGNPNITENDLAPCKGKYRMDKKENEQ